jgi:cell division GTPase FtsZ
VSDWEQIKFDFRKQSSAEGKSMDEVSQKLQANNANIKVFGIGGGGLNAINNMIRSGLTGVEFFAANTDAQALASALPTNKIRLGDDITKGRWR